MENQLNRILQKYGYDVLKTISFDRFSAQFIVKCAKFQQTFLCKVCVESDVDRTYIDKFNREVDALMALDHPMILRVYDKFKNGEFDLVFTELVTGISFMNYIENKKRFTSSQIIKFTGDLIDSLAYMHSLGYVLNSVKPSAIHVDGDKLKLIDYSATKFVESGEMFNKKKTVNNNYLPPEAMGVADYNPYKCEVWSLGVTLFYISTGRLPYSSNHMKYIIEEIKTGHDHLTSIPKQVANIIEAALTVDPEQRPLVPELKLAFDTFGDADVSPLIRGAATESAVVKPTDNKLAAVPRALAGSRRLGAANAKSAMFDKSKKLYRNSYSFTKP